MIPDDYTTERELAFVKGLSLSGYCADHQHKAKATMEKYLAAARVRMNWDQVDGAAVIDYVEKLLKGE